MEDPGSSRIQVYEKDVFNKLNEQGSKDGMQQQSVFEQQGLGVEILHDPTD